MFYKKIIAVIFCFAMLAQSFAQTTPVDEPKKDALPPELEAKALKLLNDLAREAEQFYLPENRVKARIVVADMLWEYDEKPARAIFQNAVTDMNSMIGQWAATIPEETQNSYIEQNRVTTLRSELLLTLAARDPKAALDALQALGGRNAEGGELFPDDRSLELSLAEQIAEKDPKQAYDLAKKNLEGDLNYGVFTALQEIYKKDADLGVKLAKDIVAKIKEKKLGSPYDSYANSNANSIKPMTNGNLYEGAAVNVWQVQQFLEMVKTLNRLGAKEKKTPVLSEVEIKGLVEMLAQKYLNQPYLSSYEVAKSMPEIAKYFPALAQAIRRKLAATPSGGDIDGQLRLQAIQDEIEDKSVEEIFRLAEKKPEADRDAVYRQAAEKMLNEGDAVKAKEIYSKVKGKQEYDYLRERIEGELPSALARSGDLKATREILATLKTPEERIEILTNLAAGIALKGDKKTAAALVEEARSIYSGKMKKRKDLNSILQIGYAFSVIEPPQSFAMIESNLSFINDVIAAGVLLDEFNELGSVESDEVRLDVVESESYRNMKNGVAMIRSLATADFERLNNLADRFSRPEARFFARYRIAEALLNANAEEYEKEMRTKAEERYYGDY